jgi:hypothetical protein
MEENISSDYGDGMVPIKIKLLVLEDSGNKTILLHHSDRHLTDSVKHSMMSIAHDLMLMFDYP